MSIFRSQQLPSEHENGENSHITHPDFSYSFSGVESGLDFMLSHFREPLFPRKVSTAATNREQRTALDKGHAMTYFEGALSLDCRISAFGVNQTNPDLIFIDLDACNFGTVRGLKLALTRTLNNIKDKLLNAQPTILWSGRGYHVIQPIDCPVNLDEIKEFAALTDSPNNKFLQFAERYLTGNKQDSGHHPALKSCMLRVPHSHNAKCKEAGVDSEVKIMQEWNGFRPDYRLLIGSFYADLVGKNQERYRETMQSRTTWLRNNTNRTPAYRVDGVVGNLASDYGPIDWIEKLLKIPIDDYRKHTRDLILVPYLLVRRGMTDETQIVDIIMKWADRCGQLRRLDPSRHEFERRIRSRIYEAMESRIPPMRFDTFKEHYPNVYEALNLTGGA